jgi:hypothetical protein
MPIPVLAIKTGTSWTVDVSTLILSTNLGYKDFFVRVGSTAVTDSLSNWTKTNPALLTYSGPSLAANTPVLIYRDSDRNIAPFTFGDINSAANLNEKILQLQRVVEDCRFLTGVT